MATTTKTLPAPLALANGATVKIGSIVGEGKKRIEVTEIIEEALNDSAKTVLVWLVGRPATAVQAYGGRVVIDTTKTARIQAYGVDKRGRSDAKLTVYRLKGAPIRK